MRVFFIIKIYICFIYLIRQMWIFFTDLKYREPQVHEGEHFSKIA